MMDPDVRKEILQHVDRREGRTPLFLYVIGLLFVAVAVVGIVGGAGALPAFVGPITHLCVGVLFVYVGALIQERQRLGRAFRELLESFEAFNQTFYGKDYKVQRQAVDILIRSLHSDNASVREKVQMQLVRITGQSFPPEPVPWEEWWAQNRATFARQPAASEET